MGRTTSLTAFLSQWSSASRAGGPENLARTSVPALLLTYTADQSTFPSTRDAWLAAGGERIRNVDIVGGDHYLAGRADLQMRVADEIAAFAAGAITIDVMSAAEIWKFAPAYELPSWPFVAAARPRRAASASAIRS